MSKPKSSSLPPPPKRERIHKRSSFILRLPTGKKVRFRDADHQGAAWEGMAAQRFAHQGQLVDFISHCPNGYSDFLEDLDLGGNTLGTRVLSE